MIAPVETVKPVTQRDFAARYQRKRQAKAWFASSPTRSRMLKLRSRKNPNKYKHDAQASEPANRPNQGFGLDATKNAQLQDAQASEPADPPNQGFGLNAAVNSQPQDSRAKIVTVRLGSDQRDVPSSMARRLKWLTAVTLPIYGMVLQWAR